MKENIIKIRLTASQVNYLRNVSFIQPLFDVIENMEMLSEGGASLTITVTIAEKLRDLFTERLARVGFDDDYELTNEGRLLEDLIDQFYSN